MKTQISGLDLSYLVQEFQEFVGSKVSKVFQFDNQGIFIQLHKSGVGKQLFSISKKFTYLSNYKLKPESSKVKIYPFCKVLRNLLTSAYIRSIEQHAFERIMVITFEKHTEKYYLIAEFFDKGNILLCDTSYTIINLLESQVWKNRNLTHHKSYEFREKKYNTKKISFADFEICLNESEQESVVKSLAVDLGLGGLYAEFICKKAFIEKDSSPHALTKDSLSTLHASLMELFTYPLSPLVYIADDKKDLLEKESVSTFDEFIIFLKSRLKTGFENLTDAVDNLFDIEQVVKDIVPFSLPHPKSNYSLVCGNSYSYVLDQLFQLSYLYKKAHTELKKLSAEYRKIKIIVDSQEAQIVKSSRMQEELNKVGTKIYEHYGLISDTLTGIKELHKTKPWPEIKTLLMKSPKVFKVDEKSNSLILDLE